MRLQIFLLGLLLLLLTLSMGNPSRTIRSGQRRRGSGPKTPRPSASPPINPAHDNAEAQKELDPKFPDAQSYTLGMNQQPVGDTDTHKNKATGCFSPQEHSTRMETLEEETDPLPEPMNSLQTAINYLALANHSALENQKLWLAFRALQNGSQNALWSAQAYIRHLELEVSNLRKENEDLKREVEGADE